MSTVKMAVRTGLRGNFIFVDFIFIEPQSTSDVMVLHD